MKPSDLYATYKHLKKTKIQELKGNKARDTGKT